MKFEQGVLDGGAVSMLLSGLGGLGGGHSRRFFFFGERNHDLLDLNSGWDLSCQHYVGHIN